MNGKPNLIQKARRRVSMRSALLLTLCACLLATAGRIALLFVPAVIRPLPELLLTLLAFGGGAYLGLCVLDGNHAKIVPRMQLSRAQILYLSLLGVLLIAPATLLSDLWRSLFAPGVAAQDAGMAYGAEASLLIVQMIKSALVVPVCEELFFRGYLLSAMERNGRARAVLVSALCFALSHGVSVGGLVVHTLLGLLLGVLMLRTRSVFAPILVHGCYNLTVVLVSCAGLSPLFDRLSLISCAGRLALCAAFAAVLKKAFSALGTGRAGAAAFGWKLKRREIALLIAAALAVSLASVSAPVIEAAAAKITQSIEKAQKEAELKAEAEKAAQEAGEKSAEAKQ